MANFSTTLKELRIARGLTQTELSKSIGVSRSAIGMYENGSREPDFETLEVLADFFNVDINYLLGRTLKTTVFPKDTAHSTDSEQYYLNEDARNMAQFMYENPEYKVLFDASRKVKKEDIEFVKQMLDRFRQD